MRFAGSIFEVEKRKRVVPLIYAQSAVAVAEVAFLGKVLTYTNTAPSKAHLRKFSCIHVLSVDSAPVLPPCQSMLGF